MYITKLSMRGDKTTVRYLNENDELKVSTEAAPRPELKVALINPYAIVCDVFRIDSPMKREYDVIPAHHKPLKFVPVGIKRPQKKDEADSIKISCQAHAATHGLGTLVTPAISVSALSCELQALIAEVVAEAEPLAKGERAQMEFEALVGKGAA